TRDEDIWIFFRSAIREVEVLVLEFKLLDQPLRKNIFLRVVARICSTTPSQLFLADKAVGLDILQDGSRYGRCRLVRLGIDCERSRDFVHHIKAGLPAVD